MCMAIPIQSSVRKCTHPITWIKDLCLAIYQNFIEKQFSLWSPSHNLYWTTTSIRANWVYTYLVAASIVLSLLVLSPLSPSKAPGQASPRMHQGQCSPSSLPVQDTSLSQWMTVDWSSAPWSLGYQAKPPPSSSSVPLPSPLSHSPQWEWGLRERHKQKGRTINNTVFIPVHQLLHSMLTQQIYTVFRIPSSSHST